MRSYPFAPEPDGSATAISPALVDRHPFSPRSGAGCAVDLVLLSPRQGHLAVFIERAIGESDGDKSGWALPWGTPWPTDASLDECARRIASRALRHEDTSA